MEIITNPCWEKLHHYLGQCREQLRILSPYIKEDAIHRLMKYLAPDVPIQLITRVRLADYYQKASDLAALTAILSDDLHQVRSHSRLHAKVYLIDCKYALVTSANLTISGLTTNYEYGVMCCEPAVISQIQEDFTTLWEDVSITHQINLTTLEAMQSLLTSLPPAPQTRYPADEPGTGILYGLKGQIQEQLSDWEKYVFEIMDSLPGSTVRFQQLQSYEESMKQRYPAANTPLATTRRVLQQLRDKGLLEFVDNQGTYRKLWS